MGEDQINNFGCDLPISFCFLLKMSSCRKTPFKMSSYRKPHINEAKTADRNTFACWNRKTEKRAENKESQYRKHNPPPIVIKFTHSLYSSSISAIHSTMNDGLICSLWNFADSLETFSIHILKHSCSEHRSRKSPTHTLTPTLRHRQTIRHTHRNTHGMVEHSHTPRHTHTVGQTNSHTLTHTDTNVQWQTHTQSITHRQSHNIGHTATLSNLCFLATRFSCRRA